MAVSEVGFVAEFEVAEVAGVEFSYVLLGRAGRKPGTDGENGSEEETELEMLFGVGEHLVVWPVDELESLNQHFLTLNLQIQLKRRYQVGFDS